MVVYDEKPEKHIIIHGDIPRRFKSSRLVDRPNGKVYVTFDGDIFKQMTLPEDRYEDFVSVAKLQSPNVAFPKETVYRDERRWDTLQGYITDRVYGNKLANLDPRTKIRHLIAAIAEFEKEVIRLSKEEGLLFNNLSRNNLFFLPTTWSLKAVHADQYRFNTSEEHPIVAQMNIRQLSITVLYLLVDMGKNLFKDEKLFMYFDQAVTNGKRMPSEVLTEILNAIEKEYGEELLTVDDFQKGLSLIQRK